MKQFLIGFFFGACIVSAIWVAYTFRKSTIEPDHSEYLKIIAAEKDSAEIIRKQSKESEIRYKAFYDTQESEIANLENKLYDQQHELPKKYKYYDTVSIFILDGYVANTLDSLGKTRFAH